MKGAPVGQRTVLVVSADARYLERASAALEALGTCTPVCAANGRAARERMAQSSIDIVVSELRLDDESGLELLRAFEEQSPSSVRVLAVAYEDLPEVVRLASRGLLSWVVPRESLLTRANVIVDNLAHAAIASPGRGDASSDEPRNDRIIASSCMAHQRGPRAVGG